MWSNRNEAWREGATPHLRMGPPLVKRSFVTFDRGGQTGPPRSNAFFVGAADDTGAADDGPATVRRPSDDCPTTVKIPDLGKYLETP